MHKAVTQRAEAKKLLSRRRQSEYSMNRSLCYSFDKVSGKICIVTANFRHFRLWCIMGNISPIARG